MEIINFFAEIISFIPVLVLADITGVTTFVAKLI